jgi:hypothetical protein
VRIPNVICMHEEDYGILWKHTDLAGRSDVRRSRRFVVSYFSTIGNYDYGFYWNFGLDGSIEVVAKATGIVFASAGEPRGAPAPCDGAGPRRVRPRAPAPLLRTARRRDRRRGQPARRDRRPTRADGPREPLRQRLHLVGDDSAHRETRRSARPIPRSRGCGRCRARPARTTSAGPPRTTWCRSPRHCSWPTRSPPSPRVPPSRRSTSGRHASRRGRSGRPVGIRTRTRAEQGYPSTPPPTATSTARTSCCGTPSV